MSKIIIKGKTYQLVFGFRVFRKLGTMWNLPGFNEVMQRLSSLDQIVGMPNFEQSDTITDLVLASIDNENISAEINGDDVMDCFMQNPEVIQIVIEGLTSSLPKYDEPAGKIKRAKPNKK